MKDEDIVCICSSVTVRDVREALEKYPNESIEEIQYRLQAGLRCGLCLEYLAPGVDISYFDVVERINNSKTTE